MKNSVILRSLYATSMFFLISSVSAGISYAEQSANLPEQPGSPRVAALGTTRLAIDIPEEDMFDRNPALGGLNDGLFVSFSPGYSMMHFKYRSAVDRASEQTEYTDEYNSRNTTKYQDTEFDIPLAFGGRISKIFFGLKFNYQRRTNFSSSFYKYVNKTVPNTEDAYTEGNSEDSNFDESRFDSYGKYNNVPIKLRLGTATGIFSLGIGADMDFISGEGETRDVDIYHSSSYEEVSSEKETFDGNITNFTYHVGIIFRWGEKYVAETPYKKFRLGLNLSYTQSDASTEYKTVYDYNRVDEIDHTSSYAGNYNYYNEYYSDPNMQDSKYEENEEGSIARGMLEFTYKPSINLAVLFGGGFAQHKSSLKYKSELYKLDYSETEENDAMLNLGFSWRAAENTLLVADLKSELQMVSTEYKQGDQNTDYFFNADTIFYFSSLSYDFNSTEKLEINETLFNRTISFGIEQGITRSLKLRAGAALFRINDTGSETKSEFNHSTSRGGQYTATFFSGGLGYEYKKISLDWFLGVQTQASYLSPAYSTRLGVSIAL
jgi:hypothetical protein